MADECLMAIPDIEGIDYTTKEYLKFVTHIQNAALRLNKESKWRLLFKIYLSVAVKNIASTMYLEFVTVSRTSNSDFCLRLSKGPLDDTIVSI